MILLLLKLSFALVAHVYCVRRVWDWTIPALVAKLTAHWKMDTWGDHPVTVLVGVAIVLAWPIVLLVAIGWRLGARCSSPCMPTAIAKSRRD